MFIQWLRTALPAFMVKSRCLPDSVGCVTIPKWNTSLQTTGCNEVWQQWELQKLQRWFCVSITLQSQQHRHDSPHTLPTIPFPQGFLSPEACSSSRDWTLPLLRVALHHETQSQMSQQGPRTALAARLVFLQCCYRAGWLFLSCAVQPPQDCSLSFLPPAALPPTHGVP